MECAAVPVSLKSLNVLLPLIVRLAVLAPASLQKLLNVLPPPENVLAVDVEFVILIVEVSAFRVRFDTDAVFQTVPVPVNVHVPLPIEIVRVVESELLNVGLLKLKSLASKCPAVTVNP